MIIDNSLKFGDHVSDLCRKNLKQVNLFCLRIPRTVIFGNVTQVSPPRLHSTE